MIKTWWMMEIDSEKYGNLSQKSEFEFTFLLNDSSEALHLLNFLHRKYKIIYNNDIFVRKNASLNSESNNAIILIYIEDLFFA